MRSGRRCSWGLLIATVLLSGCAAYRYVRDATPDIEKSRRDYVYNNPGNKYNSDIESGRIREGMSRLQVRVTWGDPDRIPRSGPAGETWSYEESDASRGSTVYMLRFEGERLAHVDVERTTPLGADALDKAPTKDDKDVRPTTGVKPGQ